MISFFDAQIIRSLKLNFLGLLFKLLKPIYLIVFARMLGVELFGMYIFILILFELLSKLSIAGMGGAIIHLLEDISHSLGRYKGQLIHSVAVGVMLWSVLICLALYIMIPWFFDNFMNKPGFTEHAIYFLPYLPVFSVQNIYLNSLRHTLDLKAEVLTENIFVPLATLLLGLCLGHLYGIKGLLLAHMLACGLSIGIFLYYVHKFFNVSSLNLKIYKQIHWPKFFKDGFYHVGYRSLSLLKHHLDTLVIGYFLTAKSIAIYSIAIEMSSLLRKVRMGFESILMPFIKKTKIDSQQHKDEFKIIILWISLASMGLGCLLIFFSDFWFLIFGKGFLPQDSILIPLVLSQYFFVIFGTLETVLYMYDRGDIAIEQSMIMLAVNLILTTIGVHHFGIVGAAWATCISAGSVGILTSLRYHKISCINPYNKTFILSSSVIWLLIVLYHMVFERKIFWSYVFLFICFLLLFFFFKKSKNSESDYL